MQLTLFAAGEKALAAKPTRFVDGEPCDPSVQVGDSATTRCTLTFDLKQSGQPTDLRYSPSGAVTGVGDQRSASAVFSIQPCTPCETECTYLESDLQNCGTCRNGTHGRLQSDPIIPGSVARDLRCENGTITCAGQPALVFCESTQYGPAEPACLPPNPDGGSPKACAK